MAGAPVEAVQRVPLFADLSKRELREVARLFKERRFGAGETIVKEGSGGATFYLIEEGEAKVSVRGDDRGKLVAGDYFGEIALLDEGERAATIVAATDLRCYGLTLWEFRPLVLGNASIGWKLAQTLAKMLRDERAARRADGS